MNVGRYVWGSLAVFVFIFLAEWLFHGIIMGSTYQEAIGLLRPEDNAGAYSVWMILGFLILAFGFGFVFVKGYENKGCMEGLRYGLYVAVAFGVSTKLVNFAVFPYPASWVVAWLIGETIIMIVAGLVFAAIYKPKPAVS